MISSLAMPATGEPRKAAGESPHASRLVSPAASRRSQIAGTSSIRIQWYWMFSRSVMSAVSRAKSMPMLPRARTARGDEQPAVGCGPAS